MTTLDNYDSQFLDCRDLRHAWIRVGAFHAGGGVINRVLACERCGCERYDQWTAGGARIKTRYHYTEGYLIKGGVDASQVRSEVLHRVDVYETQQDMLDAVFTRKPRRKVNR